MYRAHIDHVRSGKLGDNSIGNLRTLCPVCHALRIDKRHERFRNRMLLEGKLPKNWRQLLWE